MPPRTINSVAWYGSMLYGKCTGGVREAYREAYREVYITYKEAPESLIYRN